MLTMRDVAQKAGVSPTTVSFVLSGRRPAKGTIPEETQQRVLEAARDLGYRRNQLAQAIVSGHNKMLGFLAHRVDHEFIASMLSGALEEARVAGYGVQILQLNTNSLDKEAIEICLEMRLAGLVTVDLDESALQYLHSEMRPHGVPIAFLDTSFQQEWGIHVASDDQQGCELVIDHLASLGHQRIAFIGGEVGRGMAVSRTHGYRQAMQKHGLELREEYLCHARWQSDIAQEYALRMLALPERPTAIFCANDSMAIGVQRAARQLGLRMPEELSVVGFANSSIAGLADPPLTSVNQPSHEIGRVAVRHILSRLTTTGHDEDVNQKSADIALPTTLVVRSSTALVPAEEALRAN